MCVKRASEVPGPFANLEPCVPVQQNAAHILKQNEMQYNACQCTTMYEWERIILFKLKKKKNDASKKKKAAQIKIKHSSGTRGNILTH